MVAFIGVPFLSNWLFGHCPRGYNRKVCPIWNCPGHFVDGKYSKEGSCK